MYLLWNSVVQDFLGSEDSVDRKALLRKKADWACNINEPRAAAEMYLSAGDTLRAIDIIGANGWTDMLVPFAYLSFFCRGFYAIIVLFILIQWLPVIKHIYNKKCQTEF